MRTDIPEKANRILRLILIAFLLIILRLWYLAVIEHDQKFEESRKPQRRVVVEPSRRAIITDRFGLPLAINKMQYRVAILYSQFGQIPAVSWIQDPSGKKIKQYKRKEYIANLASVLSKELNLNRERLEDLIYSKASLYYNLPFVIKDDLTEKEYFRLKMLEKDWLGIQVQHVPKRTYPQGKVGADILGYMGAINREEYEAIIGEMKALEIYIHEYKDGQDPIPLATIEGPEQAQQRLKALRARAYSVNDSIGKAGIERRFDTELRGMQGRKTYYSDARGNYLRELPGSYPPMPGNNLKLSISIELQEFAEKLLIQNERVREAQVSNPAADKPPSTKQPWIKGGAIIAMDPKTGEIYALASYPRYDPNDFITSGNPDTAAEKKSHILRWLENEEYIAQIWDQKRPLEREAFNDALQQLEEESISMTWDRYLDAVLATESPTRKAISQIHNVKQAIELQQAIDGLLVLSGQADLYWLLQVLFSGDGHHPYGQKLPNDIRQAITENLEQQSEETAILKQKVNHLLNQLPEHYDKAMLIDLCRLAVDGERISDALADALKHQSLSTYRMACAAVATVEPIVRAMSADLFHEIAFKPWRQENGKRFIQLKRKEEKAARQYTKPYIDYLDAEEKQLFQQFWLAQRWKLIRAFLGGAQVDHELTPYLNALTQWQKELSQGAHQSTPWNKSYSILQKALKEIPTPLAEAYLQSLRTFHELDRPLLGQYKNLRKTNGRQLEKHLAAAFYPRYGFGYGRSYAYRQAACQGSLFKLVTAYAGLIQKYQELGGKNATPTSLNPFTMTDVVQKHGKQVTVGYLSNGTAIPQIYKGGRIPSSSIKTIGQIEVLRALETSSNPYFALLAGDILHKPDDLIDAAKLFSYGAKTGIELPGEIKGRLPIDLSTNRTGLYSTAIGQHTLVVTPLQTCLMLSAINNGGKILKPRIVNQIGFKPTSEEVKSVIPLPGPIQNILIEGMQRVMARMHQGSLSGLSKLYENYPEAISDYLDLKGILYGKTSTSEALEQIDLDLEQGTNKYTHIWFGGFSHDPSGTAFVSRDANGEPDLVVVVYLRFGKFGREAAPLGAQMVKFWHDLRQGH